MSGNVQSSQLKQVLGGAVVSFFVSQQQGEQVSFHSMLVSQRSLDINSVRDRKVLSFDQ